MIHLQGSVMAFIKSKKKGKLLLLTDIALDNFNNGKELTLNVSVNESGMLFMSFIKFRKIFQR